MDYRIYPPEQLIEDGIADLPLSKSMLNRRMVIEALTPGCPEGSLLYSGTGGDGPEIRDIAVIRAALRQMLCQASKNLGAAAPYEEVNADESGTALRFLCAFIAATPGCQAVLTGCERLCHRPVRPLVDALRQLGAEIEYVDQEGFAPLKIKGKRLAGGEVKVDATLSSQYVSALMLTAPTMERGLTITFDGEPSSLPYIKMTAAMIRRRGIEIELTPLSVSVAHGTYRPVDEPIEADWSAAAFWYEVVALTAGWVSMRCGSDPRKAIVALPGESIQGDSAAAEFFGRLGVETAPSDDFKGAVALSPSPEMFGRLDADLRDYPDMAPALAVTACMLGVPFRLVGLGALHAKESDRLQAIIEEMEKVGVTIERIRDYGMEWDGKRHPITAMPVFDPRNDHRMAMACAPCAAYIPGIVVKDVECVDKSYPGYWDVLRALGFTLTDASVPADNAETSADTDNAE